MKLFQHIYIYTLLILAFVSVTAISGQGIAVNQSGAVADPSAIMDINAQQKGLLIPRLSTIERNNINLPAKALLIFNTSTSRFEVNTGSAQLPTWEAIVTLESLSLQNLTWKQGGNFITANSGVLGSYNAKSIGFVTNNIIRLYIDSTTGRVGINTQSPKSGLHIATTDALLLPVGNTAQRPVAPIPGMIRYNAETGKLEGFTSVGWKALQ